MTAAALPKNEAARLKNLQNHHILDTLSEDAWNDITRMASAICEAPISAISFVDEDRQWFKSIVGLEAQETHRNEAFCAHTILDDQVFVIEDATKDSRFLDNALVTGAPNIRFYAGTQIVSEEGFHLGALCVIDTQPRTLSEAQKTALEYLGRQVNSLLKLHLRNHQLSEALQAKEKFLAMVSPKLLSPLEKIVQIMDLIGTTLDEAPQTPMVDELEDCSSEARIEALRLFNRLENMFAFLDAKSQNPQIEIHSVSVQDTVQDILGYYAPEIELTKNEVTLNIPESLTLETNENMFYLILDNLIVNALKFTDCGDVQISSQIEGDTLKIAISDTGIGLREVEKKKIFELFYQVDPDRDLDGIGIGLPLIKELTKHLKGDISVESVFEEGATFTLSLPLKR